MSSKLRHRAGFAGFIVALVVSVTSCMKVDITMPEGPRGADGLSAYEVWKAGVADGTIDWDKNATAIVDFFKFLKGKDGKDGKDADMSSVAGFSFLAALVGGGTVLGILSTIDYLYTHGMLPKNSVPWRINQ